jgi:hypothetical protein
MLRAALLLALGLPAARVVRKIRRELSVTVGLSASNEMSEVPGRRNQNVLQLGTVVPIVPVTRSNGVFRSHVHFKKNIVELTCSSRLGDLPDADDLGDFSQT